MLLMLLMLLILLMFLAQQALRVYAPPAKKIKIMPGI